MAGNELKQWAKEGGKKIGNRQDLTNFFWHSYVTYKSNLNLQFSISFSPCLVATEISKVAGDTSSTIKCTLDNKCLKLDGVRSEIYLNYTVK